MIISVMVIFIYVVLPRINTKNTIHLKNVKSVYYITIDSKFGEKIHLKKDKFEKWWLNSNTEANHDKIYEVLDWAMKIKSEPINKKDREKIIASLQKFSVKFSLYDEDSQEITTYHIGQKVLNQDFCYGILEKNGRVDPNPILLYIPGYSGEMKYFFPTSEMIWRNRTLIQAAYDDIKTISVNYVDNPQFSFYIEKDENYIKLKPVIDSIPLITDISQEKMMRYLLSYERLSAETEILNDSLIQIITKSPKYAEIQLAKLDKSAQTVWLYHMKNRRPEYLSPAGEEIPFDLELLWAYRPDTKKYYMVQYHSFGPILQTYSFFKSDTKPQEVSKK